MSDPSKPGGPAKTILGWMPSAPGAPPAADGAAQHPPAQYPAASPTYPAAPPQYPAPAQPYPAPAQPYPAPAPQYPAPAQPYPAPAPQYPAPAQPYPAPAQPYPAPAQPYQAPVPQYPAPAQPYPAPAQPYQAPAQPYQAPVPQYHAPPVQPSFVPAAQPNFQAPGHQVAASRADEAPAARRGIAGADATVGVSARKRFIRLTYLHLFGAILVFAGLEWLLMKNETIFMKVSVPILEYSLGSRYNWLGVLAIFMAVSWVAEYFAQHTKSRPLQYLGLLLYVVAEALIFLPLLFLAEVQAAEYLAKHGTEAHIIRDAAYLTLGIFGALTASVFFTKKDFSFLGGALAIASGAALILIVISILAGFSLGILFSVAMVVLAAGYVLFYTSQVLAHYDPEDYVAASLALFSSVALMFWYVIRILMKLRE